MFLILLFLQNRAAAANEGGLQFAQGRHPQETHNHEGLPPLGKKKSQGNRSGADLAPDPGSIVAEVKGIACSFCAYGIEKNLSRVGFLDKTQHGDGVLVDIKKGLITMALRPSEKIDFPKINKAIVTGGYDLKAFHFQLSGPVSKEGDIVRIENTATGQVFQLVNAEQEPWNPEALMGETMSIQAVLPHSLLTDWDSEDSPVVQVKSAIPLKKE